MTGRVVAVSRSGVHGLAKRPRSSIRLVTGLGVAGDAHLGEKVQHLSRVARDPDQPNLRQVHLVQAELHDDLRSAGFAVTPGDIGENITTRGVDLLALPRGTRLQLGPSAIIEITGLRNPCRQLNELQPGLLPAVLDRAADGQLIRKAGVMAVVISGGDVSPDDEIRLFLPPKPHRPLRPV